MNNHFMIASVFLIKTVFDLYLLILMMRLILAYTGANYFNPLIRLIVQVTKPLVHPLRRIIPNYHRIEFSTIVIIFIFEIIKLFLIFSLINAMPSILFLLSLAFIASIRLLLQTFFYAILLQAIISWFQPGRTPATEVLYHLTSPILIPLQRIIPPISGFDITPIPALLLLQLLLILLP